MANGEPTKRGKRVKLTSQRQPDTSRPTTQDFERVHFCFLHLAMRFHTSFMGKLVTPSYYTDINDFSDITVLGSTIRVILIQWKVAQL